MLFYKGKNEKLASGLFEPFISHLKVARDEIAKGGYSICLQPPVLNVHWFTKATLERFVRFVSTPAVLERFVSLEKEILQIEKSVQDNEVSKTSLVGKQEEVHEPVANLTRRSSDSSELKDELRRKDATLPEENSKIQLQRLLETRKTLLRKEQAMAYARGLVAGFAMENMDDLICFAEAFGASRLREACANFIELCKKKHADHLWMEELAAVKACSPVEFSVLGTTDIVLTNESNSPNPDSNESPDSKKVENSPASIPAGYPMHMQWPNQMPPYMFNFPGYAQQMPSYQGYPFPPMQPNPHYPRNGHQPRKQKSSSRKKEKLLNGEEDEYSEEEEEQTESSATDSGSDSVSRTHRQDRNHTSPDHSSRRKHKKKSSRTIVIRNINYITPKKRDGEKGQVSDGLSSDEDEFSGKDSSLNSRNGKSRGSEKISDDNIEAVVNREGKTDNNWEAFQNILSNENASTKWVETDALTPALELESGKVLKQRMVAADSFVVKGRDDKTDSRMKFDEFGNEESSGALRKSSNYEDEVLFNSRRLEGSGNGFGDVLAMSAEDSSIIKSGKGEDWFVADHSGKLENQDSTNGKIPFDVDQVLSFEGDNSYPQKSKREVFIDDSIMVQARPELDGQYESQWKTEISIMEDLTSASKQENGTADNQDQKTVYDSNEPDDLFMVIGRDEGLESARDSMNFDYEIDLSLTEANRRYSEADAEKKSQDGEKTPVKNSSGTKKPVKEARPNALRGSLNSRPGNMSRIQKTSPLVSKAKTHKSKFEQEEEMRKKMEELAIERQKRIAERTAAAKKPTSETKTAKNSIKLDKSKSIPAARATGRVSAVKF